ncbi:ribonuclease HII [Chlamydia gallinacea]|uniref:Ribonuclease HII n=3 Tax=Chlamydia gallinacea TaxID=1457153 RepID=A0A173DXV1_9CHLA|nr:ribonuclease HII [Chlamydia gallinacea]ANG65739.1 ribonuclease HII [Chlamydia gallinacea 08-1274/3]AQT77196.1 ribonuclease HII [Chlamydia gallinacea]MBX6680296.1 ribonuclease HII [Chlamydia gallinacea]MBX6687582.1 ribonuclease HII [Chlamydia gallinacea]
MKSSTVDMEQQFLSKTILEQEVFNEGFSIIAGVDEVGRGPLAGPVVAGACILPRNKIFLGVDDSKKLAPEARKRVRDMLVNDPDVYCGIGVVSVERIDEINILEATKEAMIQAISSLPLSPDFLLVDGLYLPHDIPCKKVIKGDSKSVSIAAASILAKEYRDDLMVELHQRYPGYGFDKHKGYGTAAHLAALELLGPCDCHRKSFSPVRRYSKIV